ncbi:unnamed protein product [Ectocarpus sp. CCAP 1310/34]|nr:unnamed protein product [Ectocarpus sp. CCAP 1310/34]
MGEVLENAETETAATVAAVAAAPYLLDLAGEQSFVPHTWLLPRCRGVVHHGGSGTTGACLSAGAVQVVIPLAWDQFFFADQVEHMGVGVRVLGTRPPQKQPTTREHYLDRSAGHAMGSITTTTTTTVAPIEAGAMDNAVRLALSEGMKTSACRYREIVLQEAESGVETTASTIVAELRQTPTAAIGRILHDG